VSHSPDYFLDALFACIAVGPMPSPLILLTTGALSRCFIRSGTGPAHRIFEAFAGGLALAGWIVVLNGPLIHSPWWESETLAAAGYAGTVVLGALSIATAMLLALAPYLARAISCAIERIDEACAEWLDNRQLSDGERALRWRDELRSLLVEDERRKEEEERGVSTALRSYLLRRKIRRYAARLDLDEATVLAEETLLHHPDDWGLGDWGPSSADRSPEGPGEGSNLRRDGPL
jgi:hypothetical protein